MTQVPLERQIAATLRRVRRATGVSLAFAGEVLDSRQVRLSFFDGPNVGAMRGVELRPGHGLGGKVAALSRTIALNDYLATPLITHHYDRLISAEGLRAMVATPVIVERATVAVVYGAFRDTQVIGDRIQDAVTAEARALEQRLAVAAATENTLADPADACEAHRLRERIRDTYSDLRALAARTDDPETRAAILRAGRRLLDDDADPPPVMLTPRECDIVAHAARGLSNRRIGEALGLTTGTVKSYMKSAMNKLGASTRHEAVISARRTGQIP
ncbi:LuxR C-terminal-related transcriptional regulator [Actinomadura miaoliensis]|uniref:HTH luxR-type domain-containing protein n=1 Tax=Actinomadura miaoliensis TaxID=430685 RepID=A0ABP7VZS1_9ACTN